MPIFFMPKCSATGARTPTQRLFVAGATGAAAVPLADAGFLITGFAEAAGGGADCAHAGSTRANASNMTATRSIKDLGESPRRTNVWSRRANAGWRRLYRVHLQAAATRGCQPAMTAATLADAPTTRRSAHLIQPPDKTAMLATTGETG